MNVSELHHGSQFHDPQIEVEALLSAPPPKAAKRCDLDSTSQPEEDDDDEPNVVQAEAKSSASVENARCSPVWKNKDSGRPPTPLSSFTPPSLRPSEHICIRCCETKQNVPLSTSGSTKIEEAAKLRSDSELLECIGYIRANDNNKLFKYHLDNECYKNYTHAKTCNLIAARIAAEKAKVMYNIRSLALLQHYEILNKFHSYNCM